MAFYDKEIKRVCESCPRLLILMINSVFSKHHAENAEIIFLDKDHIEYQLLEGNMAIRMVEYGMKETIRGLRQNGDITKVSDGRYEIEIVMPLQAVVFLAGANKEDKITVKLHLPNGKVITYELPCISASETVFELSRKKMYLEAKKELDNLHKNGILNANEVELLITSLHNIEDNLLNSDDLIREKVTEMGDEDYVALSDRLIQQGVDNTLIMLVTKKIQKGKTVSQIADECEITEAEVERYIKQINNASIN